MFVPVINLNGIPLMPTTPSRARRWIESGKATPFWKGHIFCVRLNEQADTNLQAVAVGIDPGSKKEGFTVKSECHTYLNIQADAITHVKLRVHDRRMSRISRRARKTPCRKPRSNRSTLKKLRLPPSTKSRWQWKLSILKLLRSLFPISHVVCEDIKARAKKGKRGWNKSFSPLQNGKRWFYSQVPNIVVRDGWETANLRNELGLAKLPDKLSNDFHSHCVDSWVLASIAVGGTQIDNKDVLCIYRIQFHRRQLHRVNAKNGRRQSYGGTMSNGLQRGSIIRNPKYGDTYLGGMSNGRLKLHSTKTGKVITNYALTDDCKVLSLNKTRAFIAVHQIEYHTKKP